MARSGKYSSVLRRHGKEGFGWPAKAPHVGSFPLYPKERAQFALTIVTSPRYDSEPKVRAQIARRALKAHPSLKPFWHARERTIAKRLGMEHLLESPRMAANPRDRYGAAPAPGAVERELRLQGYTDIYYDVKGKVPGLGWVLAFNAKRGNLWYRINAGRMRGGDVIEIRAYAPEPE